MLFLTSILVSLIPMSHCSVVQSPSTLNPKPHNGIKRFGLAGYVGFVIESWQLLCGGLGCALFLPLIPDLLLFIFVANRRTVPFATAANALGECPCARN